MQQVMIAQVDSPNIAPKNKKKNAGPTNDESNIFKFSQIASRQIG